MRGAKILAALVLGACSAGELSGNNDGRPGGDAAAAGDGRSGDVSGDRAISADAMLGDAVLLPDAPGADGKSQPDSGPCVDPCPAPQGVTWSCNKRFMYGTNWAWLDFGADFGGIAAWGQVGVSQASATFSAAMAQMKAAGVSVIRWWMFPRFWTESISFGADDAPSGIGGTLVADIHKALELAEQHDLYVMLTPFSFDNFTPTKVEAGIYTRSIQPMIVDASRRQKLLQNLVRPVAQAVESSPHKQRMIAWDMINEPEWAMEGPNPYGGEDFTPQSGLASVTHAQMEGFLKAMASVLRQSSSALISIGSAAIKWGKAWTKVDVDFYQLHYYEWVYEWFPYTTATLAAAGLDDKPVVMGEFPLKGLPAIPSKGLPARTVAELTSDLWSHGYAGALSWAFNDSSFPWSASAVQAFPTQHPCETKY